MEQHFTRDFSYLLYTYTLNVIIPMAVIKSGKQSEEISQERDGVHMIQRKKSKPQSLMKID